MDKNLCETVTILHCTFICVPLACPNYWLFTFKIRSSYENSLCIKSYHTKRCSDLFEQFFLNYFSILIVAMATKQSLLSNRNNIQSKEWIDRYIESFRILIDVLVGSREITTEDLSFIKSYLTVIAADTCRFCSALRNSIYSYNNRPIIYKFD